MRPTPEGVGNLTITFSSWTRRRRFNEARPKAWEIWDMLHDGTNMEMLQ